MSQPEKNVRLRRTQKLLREALVRLIEERGFDVSTLFVEAITWWLEQGRPYTPREIATRSALLASALFKEASTWH